MRLISNKKAVPRMRVGDTDPGITKQRLPEPIAWQNFLGTIITISALIASIALQWGVFNATLNGQQKEMGDIKTQQAAQSSKLVELGGQTTSLTARMEVMEEQDIPSHLGKIDALVAAITQQQIDQKAQSDRAHDERIKWQDTMSAKIDQLIASVAHLEGQKERHDK